MTSGVKVVKYGGGGLLMFLEPLSKCSRGLSYILLITLHPTTFVTVDDPTLLQHRIFVLWGHQEVFDGCASSEVNLNPIVVTGWCSAEWYFDCSFSFGLVCSSSSSSYSMPIWGIYSSSVLLTDVLLLAVATVCWNIWSWFYDGVFQLHCTLRRLCEDCPNAGTGWCGLASCKLWCLACLQLQYLVLFLRKFKFTWCQTEWETFICICIHVFIHLFSSHCKCHVLVLLVILQANLKAHLHVHYLCSLVLLPLFLL